MAVSDSSDTRTTKLQAKTCVAIVLWVLLGVVFYLGQRFAVPLYAEFELPRSLPTGLLVYQAGRFLAAFPGGWLLPVCPGIVFFVASVAVRRRGSPDREFWISTISIVLAICALFALLAAIFMPLISLLTNLSG